MAKKRIVNAIVNAAFDELLAELGDDELEEEQRSSIKRRVLNRFASADDDDGERAADAVEQYRSFHWGNEPDSMGRVELPERPETLVLIGDLMGLIYRTAKGGQAEEQWIHFHDERRPPRLAYDAETGQLWILGGRYRITDAGIED